MYPISHVHVSYEDPLRDIRLSRMVDSRLLRSADISCLFCMKSISEK